ncbi:unnamed protein product [Eretmochelys imbricata]
MLDSPTPVNTTCFMGPDLEEKEALNYIDGFLKGNEQDEAKKLKFLDCVSTFSRAVLTRSPERNLAAFLSKALLVEKIKDLIDHESVDSVTGMVCQQMMLAIMELRQSEATAVGNGTIQPAHHLLLKHLLPASIRDHPGHGGCSVHQGTLKVTDEMQKALVCEDQKPNLVVLQNILEFLLPGTTSKEVHGQLRAVVRISWLIKLIAGHHKFKGVEEFRVLGQLVGCPTLCCAEQEQQIFRWVVDGLHHLYSFMLRQKCKSTGDPCPF